MSAKDESSSPVLRRSALLMGVTAVLSLCVAAAIAIWSRSVPPAEWSRPPDDLLVCSWNMEWFPSGWPEPQPEVDEDERIRAAARALRMEGVPDVLLAQEIRDADTCSNLLERIGADDLRLAVCSDFWFNPTNRGMQQLAIFSRHPVVASGFEPWSVSDFIYPPRGFAWAVLDVRGRRTAFFNVHLKSNYVPEGLDEEKQFFLNRLKRELAVRQLLPRIEELCTENADGTNAVAVVVAGDFNTALEDPRFEGESTLSQLLDAGYVEAFEGVPEADRPTLPANDFYPAVAFDHLFFKGFGRTRMSRVGAQAPMSDHCPVYVSFAVPAAR